MVTVAWLVSGDRLARRGSGRTMGSRWDGDTDNPTARLHWTEQVDGSSRVESRSRAVPMMRI